MGKHVSHLASECGKRTLAYPRIWSTSFWVGLSISYPVLSSCITTLTVRNTWTLQTVVQQWNVNHKRKTCLFIVWNPHWVQQTLQFTPLVLELFLIQSHLLWGEFSICTLCCSYSQSLQFSFLVPPGTHHCWVDRGGVIWEACPTPLHMTVSGIMCYHCVRVAVGPHCHVRSTRRQA